MQISSLNNKKIHIDEKTVICGTGLIGKLVSFGLNSMNVQNYKYYDSNDEKQGGKFLGKKILKTEEIKNLDKNTNFFIAHNYFNSTMEILNSFGFTNVYDCSEILNKANYLELEKTLSDYDLKNYKREIQWYILDVQKDLNLYGDKLNLKCIDIEITEKCSMKCANCANLMQYYLKPENANLEQLFDNLDILMKTVDHIYEFRILGGEPFMNKEIYKIINKISGYNNYENIVVYSNATIVPKNENLNCLIKDNLTVDITNYGKEFSKKHDETVQVYKENKINFRTRSAGTWTDNGEIKFYKRNKQEQQRVFDNCCVKNTTTLLDGKIYRCPYAANATKLKAIPDKKDDRINMKEHSLSSLKKDLKKFLDSEKPLLACNYCPGRDYNTKEIPAAIQASKPIEYEIHKSYNKEIN